jgi:outer membrane protein assembly factor BamB
MGPEGNLYAPVVHDQSGRAGSVVAFDSANSTQIFQVNERDAGSGLQIGNGLVASNGDFLVGGNSNLIRYTSGGMKLWTSPIRGTPTGLKFTPEGNVLAFTLNGWFQVFDPRSGRLIREVNVTPNRNGSTTACLAQGEQGNVKGERKGEEKREEEESKISSCPFTSPAVDSLNSRVFAGRTDGTDNGMIRAFSYSAQTHDIAKLWNSQLFAGNISAPVLSSDYTRVYVQSQHGRLYALDTTTGALIWSFDLGARRRLERSDELVDSVAGTPVVNEFGYILPGATKTDSPTVNSLGILKDNGTSATWAFQTKHFSAESLGASGRGNRFALMARRASDNALVLLVVDPNFGVISHTKVTIRPLPVRMTGVVLKENGQIYVGTSGTAPYRVFSPTYATTLN